VLPIAGPPRADSWVLVDEGRVVGVGWGTARDGAREHDLGEAALLPGLVNAHTHLELSFLHGAVPPATVFVRWIRDLMAIRRRYTDPRSPEILEAIDGAIAGAVASGTALVGDIGNTLVTFGPLAASPLSAVLFYELIRFNAVDPDGLVGEARARLSALPASTRVRPSLAAHAPYSVAPELFRAIRKAMDGQPEAPYSVHLAESDAEVEFLRSGTGAWRDLLDELGAWNPGWTPPGVTAVQYLDDAGFLGERALAVHGVQMETADLARLAARGATLVTCPRSNVRTGAGRPPIAAFYRSGVRVAVGTDSLAGVDDLNLFSELAEMRALAPEVPARALLDSATRAGAVALGFGQELGTIEAGKRARLIAVALPSSVGDVEEYLLSGIEPEQIHWID
jgi:aminodeoxyfutalosine deaminase